MTTESFDPFKDKTPEWKLKNSIGMQLQFYTHSGLSMEDTIKHIYARALEFTEQEKEKSFKAGCIVILSDIKKIMAGKEVDFNNLFKEYKQENKTK